MRLFPEPAARLAVKDVYRDVSFPKQRERPYVLINMVSSLDGKAAIEGKAGSIGGPADRAVMRNLRALTDAVMIGAGTLRAEKLSLAVPENLAQTREAHGLDPQPLAILVTETGDVPLQTNLLGLLPDNLLILASPETPQARLTALSSYASVEVVLDLNSALEALKGRYGVDVLLVEGGPALNHALVRNGLVDELFLTLAPKLLGGERPKALTILEGPSLSHQQSPKPELISVHLFGDELFLRYAL